jgi:hypothetical protein
MQRWWLKNLLQTPNKHISNQNTSNILLDTLYRFDKSGNNILEPYIKEFYDNIATPELVRDIGNKIGLNVYLDRLRDPSDVFIDKMLKVIINFGNLINVSETTLPNGLPSIPAIINMSREEFQSIFDKFSEDVYQDRLFLISELITP